MANKEFSKRLQLPPPRWRAVEHNLAVDVPPTVFATARRNANTVELRFGANRAKGENVCCALHKLQKQHYRIFALNGTKIQNLYRIFAQKGLKYQTFYRIFAQKGLK